MVTRETGQELNTTDREAIKVAGPYITAQTAGLTLCGAHMVRRQQGSSRHSAADCLLNIRDSE